MIKKYWISKWTREWGILEDEFGKRTSAPSAASLGYALPRTQDLLHRLEDAGFVLLDRIEFLLLSKAFDERGESLSFSPIPPDGPAAAQTPFARAPRTGWDMKREALAQAA